MTMVASALPDAPPVLTLCPFSGHDTGLERVPDPEFGTVSLDELETLVRNEWRRRLGRGAWVRDHSPAIVRALLVYALAPESPVRETIVRQLVLWELATLGGWGLGRAAIRQEFDALAGAVRSTLHDTGMDGQSSERLADAIDRKLRDLLGWDESPECVGHPRPRPPNVWRNDGARHGTQPVPDLPVLRE